MQEGIFACILMVIAYIDARCYRIPNWLLGVALLVRLIFVCAVEGGGVMAVLGVFAQGVVVALPLWILGLGMDVLFKKHTLGAGDVKLVFVTGCYLGWERNLWMLFVALVVSLVYALVRGKREIPLGPAIALLTIGMLFLN